MLKPQIMLQLAELHCKHTCIIKLCDYSIYTYVYVLGDLIHAAQYMVHYIMKWLFMYYLLGSTLPGGGGGTDIYIQCRYVPR